ncbi:DUF2269 family protein [Tenuibacillus multivorans]|uniref:Predicted integral membrane protein n=1 Tax=Tenuibacillus multivorans TaxID=237069 RepID=A0A1H0DUV8_9BACI|nr:DUF2269 family protein [Tenuibacillus multivorans]GEL76774.1 hypothetical protein TMU01_10090 [Tenuibacillus multivorans]SDN73803.1 Predicted integral membrane protein [Tenuibacillus multivorans]
MQTIYQVLVVIHIFAAIMGMGPGFILTTVTKSARTMSDLCHAYELKRRLHIFVMVGGSLLLVTGLLMGSINSFLFQSGWYLTSLILFLVALGLGPTVLKKRARPIKQLLKTHKSEEIPEEYEHLSRKLLRVEYLENLIFVIIILLMILKPF